MSDIDNYLSALRKVGGGRIADRYEQRVNKIRENAPSNKTSNKSVSSATGSGSTGVSQGKTQNNSNNKTSSASSNKNNVSNVNKDDGLTKEQIQNDLNRTTTNLGSNNVKLPGDQGFVPDGGAFNPPENIKPSPEPTSTDRSGMTATPKELLWTTEGAVEESKRTGEDWQHIQHKNLKEIEGRAGTPAEEMQLNKGHYVGKDEEGKPQYIQESPYQIKFDYNPNDPDYSVIKSNLTSNITEVDKSIGINTVVSNLKTNLQTIKDSAPGTRWSYDFDPKKIQQDSPETYNWIKENIGFKEKYNSDEAEKLTNYFIEQNQKVINQGSTIQTLKEDREALQDTLFTVEQYEKLGYEVDKTDEGYNFGLPSASKVHSSIFGDKEATALTSASFMESPLAIKTFASGIYQWATGDEKVGETRREELAQFSLGLYESTGKGDYGGYIAKVGTSPAMIQGVYLPLLTMGAGYGITGLSAGASGTVSGATSTLAKVGSTWGGRALTTGAKVGMAGIGAYGIKTTGENLYKTYQERPEALPGQLAELGFTFGMAYAGFRTGKTMYNYRNPSIGSPRDTLFQRMGETFNRKIVGRNKFLSNVSNKLGVLKEQKNMGKMYKSNSLGRIKGKIGRTVFKKQYQQAVRDYPKALASDQIAMGKKLPMYEYKDYPDYTPSRLENWQQQSAFSKYLKIHQRPTITDVEITGARAGAQVDILKTGQVSFEADVKGITNTGSKIDAGKIRGVAKAVGSGEDDVQYSIYKALYSRGKNIQGAKTEITGLGGKSSGFSKTTTYPAREFFNYRQWLQGVTRSDKLGEYNVLQNIGNIQYGEKIILTSDTGMHTRGLTSSSINKINFSKGLTQYRTVGSGTSYKSMGNIYSNYDNWYGFFKNKIPYKGSGTIADISSGKEYAGGFIKGKNTGGGLNELYSQRSVLDTIKPQLTDVVRESFKTGGTGSGGSGSYGIGNITQYEWYQAPLSSYTPTPSIVGTTSTGGYAGAYGFTSLASLDFLEGGTQQTSSKWSNVKPGSNRTTPPSLIQASSQNELLNQSNITGLELGDLNLLKEGTGTIQIDRLTSDTLTTPETDTTTETSKKTDIRKDIISKQQPMMKQSTSQSMKQLMKQDTAQAMQLQQTQQLETVKAFSKPNFFDTPSPPPPEFIDTPSPPPPELPEAPVPPPPKILDNTPKQRIKRKTKTKKKTRPKIMKKGETDKGLLSDLLSVTRSQARYGKATHPTLSKKTWKEGEKTLYSRVLTKELKKDKKKKKKKPKLLGRNKVVLI